MDGLSQALQKCHEPEVVTGNILRSKEQAGETHDGRDINQANCRCKLCGNVYKVNDGNTSGMR